MEIKMERNYKPEIIKKMIPLEPIPAEVRTQYLRPGELLSILEKFPVAYQPIGTLEWHGRHNPLGCDTIKAESLCIETAKRTGGAVMPPIYFGTDMIRDIDGGQGWGMDGAANFQLPGSFYRLPDDTLKSFYKAVCENYLARGFKLVIIVSGHNAKVQQDLFDELCKEMKISEGKELVFFTMEYKVLEDGDPRKHSDHAGHYETSMMMLMTDGRVNPRANDGCEIPELAVGTKRPLAEASAAEAEEYFKRQIDGLVKFARNCLKQVQ